ncbi:MerR family transcriptional regulator [Nesterenkonia sp. E16_7]|uniref:MerR family transcriptional regulator n=1 Tax=unclassified Nesterenkonia TaxID=2629769 RepID=UPI001A917154|nr:MULTISPECIES: MerR family transcriptional regulator [unclassified Nesterenkonia]MBO0594737.1 MerR family transcriptional regulator [Nesterenkonia sp. E16_10]MBO0597765.1 MerR family transcriptional regulator [Nesterenkonia sp. E16_7]
MAAFMTIGDFSRATRLSAKALRFYHQVGLLEPAAVDPVNSYRLYDAEQIRDARVVQHLRSLDMPVDEIKRVLQAQGQAARRDAITVHLRRMEERLAATRSAVTSLRELLVETPIPIEIRRAPAIEVLILRDTIELPALGGWFEDTRRALWEELERTGIEPTGPLGGLWSTELFLHERGGCALFLPVAETHAPAPAPAGQAAFETLPASWMAVAVHRGSDDTVGQAYAELGSHVADLGGGAAGPIRETYLHGAPTHPGVTEIGWPISEKAVP